MLGKMLTVSPLLRKGHLRHQKELDFMVKNKTGLQIAEHSKYGMMIPNCINPCWFGLIFMMFASCFEKYFGSLPALTVPQDQMVL